MVPSGNVTLSEHDMQIGTSMAVDAGSISFVYYGFIILNQLLSLLVSLEISLYSTIRDDKRAWHNRMTENYDNSNHENGYAYLLKQLIGCHVSL